MSLADLAAAVGRSRWIVLGAALLGLVAAMIRALVLTPVYSSEVVLVVVEDSAGGLAGGLSSGLGALASLAGVNVNGESRRAEYLAILQSRRMAAEFIAANDLKRELFHGRWDPQTRSWKAGFLRKAPSDADAVDRFVESVMRVTDDKKTNLVTVSVEWRDRDAAAAWANGMVSMVNERIRQAAAEEATRSIDYLNVELSKTAVSEVRRSISGMLESKLNRVMLANTQREFAFRVVDAAVPADVDRPERPKPVIDGILGTLLGAVLGLLVGLWRNRAAWWPA